jgi:hypothetical protein
VNVGSGVVLATALPEPLLAAHWFAVLSTFVAINTILYVAMSIFKILPKPYLADVVERHGRRAETRSIYPNGQRAHAEALSTIEVAQASGSSASSSWPR